MRIRDLRRYDYPDLSEFVIHFVSRRIGKPNDMVPLDLLAMSPQARLFDGVLASSSLLAFPVFFDPHPVVCFTECSPEGVRTLIREGRYEPWGIAFRKDVVFQEGGGPALYIRGDEWSGIDCLPAVLRARCTKYWPGAEPSLPDEVLDTALMTPSEWIHEREWRVLGNGSPPAFSFQPSDVAFIVIADCDAASPDHRNVVIDPLTGQIIEDSEGVWVELDAPSSRSVVSRRLNRRRSRPPREAAVPSRR